MYIKHLCLFIISLILASSGIAQKKPDKYPSLLWEITGNGLTRPSYLFGTMHVSNKLAFHLGDSFYHALRKVDEVALELNPEVWQEQMARLDKLKENYSSFVQPTGNGYITENSFRINNYVNDLILALRTEPSVVNNLLYRSYKAREDFEEDTFLDLYIYQTGRKMGKRPAGVEDYYEAEKLVLEAYGDMAREKRKSNIDLDAENIRDIFEKVQNAYRRGDLDLMDSLDNLIDRSDAFREKFLYKRNEIQANSIDSIIKKASLFVGVGAAHLPGDRGVIELLRKKGYNLRPVLIEDHDGIQENDIDKIRVPVTFRKWKSDDGAYSVDVPGELFRLNTEYQIGDRRQFADMSNGSYYIVTRVKTHAGFLNETEANVLKKIDSLLYENIPGKILSKKTIIKNGYKGLDISARTRRGDLQRYNILVTPYEIFIFKMSGKENYVDGKEAELFFSSVNVTRKPAKLIMYQPARGGFSVSLPHQPDDYLYESGYDKRREYQATDSVTGKAYLLIQKTVNNFNHLDEDSIYLALMEESFYNDDIFERRLNISGKLFNNKKALQATYKLKNGSFVKGLFYNYGNHYYVLAERSDSSALKEKETFFSSFSIKPFNYPAASLYIDTFLNLSVTTPVVPALDEGLRGIIEKSAEDIANGNNASGYISYWPKIRYGVFESETTGEMIVVQVQQLPKYFYIKDSVQYWENELNDLTRGKDLELHSTKNVSNENFAAVHVTLKDTGSTRQINKLLILKNNYKYVVTSIADTVFDTGDFITGFYKSFSPYYDTVKTNLYTSTLPLFFNELFSADSSVRDRARQAIPNIYYGLAGVSFIEDALKKLNRSYKEYFDTKTKLIAELGYINDSTGKRVVPLLSRIYKESADTSLFQNEVIKALARLKSKEAYSVLKKLMLTDPPIFNNIYDIETMFSHFEDTLRLSATLFPDLLQLTILDDYKDELLDLLVKGVDSGFINKKGYSKYYKPVYIDAKVAFKKQKNKDDKNKQRSTEEDDEDAVTVYRNPDTENDVLDNYAVLLMPFYKKKEVQDFYTGVLFSGNDLVKINTIALLLKNGKPVHDSIILKLANNEKYSSLLYKKLLQVNHQHRFPASLLSQMSMSRSFLLLENEYPSMDSLVYISKQPLSYKSRQGYIYFFKYRIQKQNDWKIGFTGLQPMNEKEVSSDPFVSVLTDVKIKTTEPLEEQLNNQLKRALFQFYESGRNFYSDRESIRSPY